MKDVLIYLGIFLIIAGAAKLVIALIMKKKEEHDA